MLPFAGAVIGIVLVGLIFILAVIFSGSRRAETSPTNSPPNRNADHLEYGATLISDGYEYYADWCASMHREFDDSIEPHLQRLYDASKAVAQHPRDQWRTLIAQQVKMGGSQSTST